MIGLLVLVALGAVVFGGFYTWSQKRGLVAPVGPQNDSVGHVSLFTEVVAYLGTILILAGGIAALGQRWNDLTDWAHVGLLAAGAVLFLGVGFAVYVESAALNAMDPNSPYGNDGQTVQDRIGQLAQQKATIHDLAQQVEPLLPAMSDQDWMSYKERWKLFGEEAAARWVIGKYAGQ